MKKRKSSIEKLKRIGLRSSLSVYKVKFSDKNIRFSNQSKIANNLARAFKRLKPLKF